MSRPVAQLRTQRARHFTPVFAHWSGNTARPVTGYVWWQIHRGTVAFRIAPYLWAVEPGLLDHTRWT